LSTFIAYNSNHDYYSELQFQVLHSVFYSRLRLLHATPFRGASTGHFSHINLLYIIRYFGHFLLNDEVPSHPRASLSTRFVRC